MIAPGASKDGIVVVDKPKGLTSHDVVSRVRAIAGTRKVGHAGTLDPMATGVLVVGLNKATRLLGHLTLASKSYLATIRLGESTVSDDAQGEVTASAPAGGLADTEVAAAIARMVGEIEQVPSAVSAVSVEGQRAYARVRAGQQVALAPRTVSISRFAMGAVRRVGDRLDVDVEVTCSSGTYVRALARDLGEALGVGGHLTMLRRTRVGPYGLADARTLESLADEGEDMVVVPMGDVARANFATFTVEPDNVFGVRNGQRLDLPIGTRTTAILAPDGELLALYARESGQPAKPLMVVPG
jgi:tRNA pseudouridine55 synthase